MLSVRFCCQSSSLTPGAPGSGICLYRFGWSYAGEDVGLFSCSACAARCFGNTWHHHTLFSEVKLPFPRGLCSLEEEVWGGGAGKVQDSHTFPGFGSITSLEIRIKAILTILELKAPPKAQWGGKRYSQWAWESAHSACCSPDLLETEAHTPMGSPAENKWN